MVCGFKVCGFKVACDFTGFCCWLVLCYDLVVVALFNSVGYRFLCPKSGLLDVFYLVCVAWFDVDFDCCLFMRVCCLRFKDLATF